MVLRGRADQLGVALSGLDRAQRTGEGSVLLVTGEPGFGKTALLRAVREQAQRRGFAVGFAAADEANRLVPGAPLLLALRSGRASIIDRTVAAHGFCGQRSLRCEEILVRPRLRDFCSPLLPLLYGDSTP